MNHAEQIERAIKELHLTTGTEMDKRILDDAFAALEQSAQKQPASIWRMIVTSRIMGLAAVAAVILIAFALFFKTQATKAVSLSQVYEALEKVSNAYIARFAAGKIEPVQKEWVSQTLKISMLQIGDQFVLLDIANGLKKTTSSAGSVQTISIPEKVLATAEKRITSTFGLVPFSDINDLQGAKWSHVGDPQVAAIVPDTEVYDLIWTTQPPDIESHKWRYFVDSKTNLPRRVEVYSKKASEEKYIFYEYKLATYPSESEIKVLVGDIFGPVQDQLSEPEYRGTPVPSRGGTSRKK